MKRVLVLALLIVGLAGQTPRGTITYLTSSAVSASTTFSAGSVTLETLNGSGSSTTTMLLTISGVYPGQTQYGTITVNNPSGSGAVSFRYAAYNEITAGSGTSAATGIALANAMTLGIVTTATTAACDATAFSGSPTYLYNSALSSATALSTAQALFGSTTTLTDSTDRTLAPGSSEVLCFQLSLPSNASNALQGASATLTFTFSGKQSAGS